MIWTKKCEAFLIADELKLHFEKYIHLSTPVLLKQDLHKLTSSSLCFFDRGHWIRTEFRRIPEFLSWTYPDFSWNNIWRFPRYSGSGERRCFVDALLLRSFPFLQRQDHLADLDLRSLSGGTTLLSDTPTASGIIRKIYPELDPNFRNLQGHWRKRPSVDGFLVEQCGWVESAGDLLGLTTRSFAGRPGGMSLLSLHNGDVGALIEQTYPEIPAPRGTRQGREGSEGGLIERMAEVYRIRRKEEWYKVSVQQVGEVYGKMMMKRRLIRMLRGRYPEEEWEERYFSVAFCKKAQQRFLGVRLGEVFEREVILEDWVFRGEGEREGVIYYLDFYVPGRGLVVEYQGRQHYEEVFEWLSLEKLKEKDMEKMRVCQQNGLKVVYVPYWWDGSIQQLKEFLSTVQQEDNHNT